jgi:C_GCAxxG_C_C family probable redox protein
MRVQREHLIQRAFDLGSKYEKEMTGCCQCTIAAIQDTLQVRDDAVFKAGSGLTAGGGVSCQGSCGGYTGGVMVMSSIFGRQREHWADDKQAKDCAHNMAKAFMDRFNQEYGSTICQAVHSRIFGRSFDLRNPKERQLFERLGAHIDKCPTVVGKAAAWATELILKELSNRSIDIKTFRDLWSEKKINFRS